MGRTPRSRPLGKGGPAPGLVLPGRGKPAPGPDAGRAFALRLSTVPGKRSPASAGGSRLAGSRGDTARPSRRLSAAEKTKKNTLCRREEESSPSSRPFAMSPKVLHADGDTPVQRDRRFLA